jgi:hypothetical protein
MKPSVDKAHISCRRGVIREQARDSRGAVAENADRQDSLGPPSAWAV